VTTRVINFLKGLAVAGPVSIAELMARAWPDTRTRLGFELLSKLRETGRLYAATGPVWVLNRRFKSDVLRRVFDQADAISTQTGQTIHVAGFASRLIGEDSPCGIVTRNVAPFDPGSSAISPP
jgi:hypothetical protein